MRWLWGITIVGACLWALLLWHGGEVLRVIAERQPHPGLPQKAYFLFAPATFLGLLLMNATVPQGTGWGRVPQRTAAIVLVVAAVPYLLLYAALL
jgi:hypothetical protein